MGLQKGSLQMQQQMEHLGHCNIAEMHFKTLSQDIEAMILRQSRLNILQHTLQLYLNEKKALSPSFLFIQITDSLHLHMRLNRIP